MGRTQVFVRFREILELGLFYVRGRRPWTRGYETYKRRAIENALRQGVLDANDLPKGYGFRIDERVVEYPWVFSCVSEGPGNLLDAGSTLNHEFALAHPKLAKKTIFISTLAPERQCFWSKGVSYVFEDIRSTCYRDGYFDTVTCISTLEHVGLDNTMLYTGDRTKNESDEDGYLLVVRELRRLLRSGGSLLLTVPFGKHENHGWFQVFDSKMVNSVVEAFSPVRFRISYFLYKEDGWRMAEQTDCIDAQYFDIHKRRDYDPDMAAASRAVCCFELVK